MNNLGEKLAEKAKEIELLLKEVKSQLKELRVKESSFTREIYYEYYYLNDCGEIKIETDEDYPFDNFRYSIGNYFETEKEAKNYKEKLLIEQELRDIARELNKGEEIDWNDGSQDKYYLLYSFYADGPMRDSSSNYSKKQGIIYCLDSDFINIAIERIGKERLAKYLKGELD